MKRFAGFRFLGLCCSALLAFSLVLTGPLFAAPAEPAGGIQNRIGAALQNRAEPARLAGRIIRLVKDGSYRQAEDLLSELLKSKRMTEDGHRLLEKVYYRLATLENLKVWDRWCSERPESHFPFTVRGMYFYERVRFLDGTNQTLLLTRKQRQQFNLYLRRAQSDIETALTLNQEDAGPAAVATALALHLELSRTEMEKRFEHGAKLDPAWLDNYRAKLLYLAPWWFGSDQKMEQFARQCFTDNSPGSNTFIITLEYLELMSDRLGNTIQGTRFLLQPSLYKLVDEGLQRYADRYPYSASIEQYHRLQEQIFEQPYVAVAAFSDSLDKDPEDRSARRGRISAYLKNNQFSEAEGDLTVLEQMTGISPFILAGKAEVAFTLHQDIKTGHRLFEQAIAQAASGYQRKRLYYKRGEFYRSRGLHELAIADYSGAIDEDPLFEQAYFGRAQSYRAHGDLPRSLEDLKVIRTTIGGTLSVKARSLMNSYLRADYSTSTSIDVSSSLRRKAQIAAPQAKPVQDSSDLDHREFLISGLRSYYQNSFEQARLYFLRVLSGDPNDPKAHYMLGQISSHHDFDRQAACIFYKQAYRLAPQTPDYLLEASRCLYKQRQFNSAISAISALLDSQDIASLNSAIHAQLLLTRGLCFEERGQMQEALADMQGAFALDSGLRAAELFIEDHTSPAPQSISVGQLASQKYHSASQQESDSDDVNRLIEKGRQQVIDGNISGARISYLKAIRFNPEAGAAHYYLGRLYFEHERDYTRALLYYNQAIAFAPQRADYYFDRAAMHFYFEQYDLARADFTKVLELRPSHERSLYYRAVCNHYLGEIEAARNDFQALREGYSGWDMEIERFRNAWKAEIDQFLSTESDE